MQVQPATIEDIPSLLSLATEVEASFGPIAAEPTFQRTLKKNIARHTAFCVRENDGPPGAPLMGGLLFCPTRAPHYEIGWLAVASQYRRQGVARRLVEYVFSLLTTPADLWVVILEDDSQAGCPARRFYQQMGFQVVELAGDDLGGTAGQVFRRRFR